jgi:hypothetical protein
VDIHKFLHKDHHEGKYYAHLASEGTNSVLLPEPANNGQ